MFKINASETFWLRVKVPVLIDYGCIDETRQIELEFRRPTTAERKMISARRTLNRLGTPSVEKWLEEGRITEEEASSVIGKPPLTDREIVTSFVVGWKGVTQDGVGDVLFSKEALDLVLNIYPTEQCVVAAFFEAQDKVLEKNLKAPPATGQSS